jgi:glutaconate CoA-transferase subunit B
VRLPGAGGAQEIATSVRQVFVMLRQSTRTFVDQLDFVSSVGLRVTVVVTDIGILEPDAGGELVLTGVHPGATIEQARAATGWPLKVADKVSHTERPDEMELAALRSLTQAATAARF